MKRFFGLIILTVFVILCASAYVSIHNDLTRTTTKTVEFETVHGTIINIDLEFDRPLNRKEWKKVEQILIEQFLMEHPEVEHGFEQKLNKLHEVQDERAVQEN